MHPHIKLSTSPPSALIRGRREGREYLSGGERSVDVCGLSTQFVGPGEHVGVDVEYAPTDGVAVEVELIVLPVVEDLAHPVHPLATDNKKGRRRIRYLGDGVEPLERAVEDAVGRFCSTGLEEVYGALHILQVLSRRRSVFLRPIISTLSLEVKRCTHFREETQYGLRALDHTRPKHILRALPIQKPVLPV